MPYLRVLSRKIRARRGFRCVLHTCGCLMQRVRATARVRVVSWPPSSAPYAPTRASHVFSYLFSPVSRARRRNKSRNRHVLMLRARDRDKPRESASFIRAEKPRYSSTYNWMRHMGVGRSHCWVASACAGSLSLERVESELSRAMRDVAVKTRLWSAV